MLVRPAITATTAELTERLMAPEAVLEGLAAEPEPEPEAVGPTLGMLSGKLVAPLGRGPGLAEAEAPLPTS